jgi:hypothetical protein
VGLYEDMTRLQELADYTVPITLRAVCDLGIADLLADGPREVGDLAARTGCDADALRRALRALACRGIFSETAPGTFASTRLAQLLRSDHPLSMRDAYPLLPADLTAWAHIDQALITGGGTFEPQHGQHYYDYLACHPDEARRFDASVSAQSRLLLRVIAKSYDWASCHTVVDVAGGDGTFLAGLLTRHKHLRGVVFDLPHVAVRARAVVSRAGITGRCAVVAGNVFAGVPARADTYLLKTILHDWDDDRAVAILRGISRMMPPEGRVLVLEAILPEGDYYHVGKLLDLHSLVLVGGPDRSEGQLAELFAAARLRLASVTQTSALAVLEVWHE